MTEEIEIPLGAFDSETIGWTYTIPEGFTAKIEDGKIIVEKKDSDEKIRKEMIDYFSQFKEDGIRGVDITPWIAWLEKQKEQKISHKGLHKGSLRHVDNPTKWMKEDDMEREQKPAEWSEEDEQWLESIIKDYEDSLIKDKDHAAVIKIKIDFLKSLRPQPHWKPSEEQIEALKYALGNGGTFDKDALKSLYNDLKKL